MKWQRKLIVEVVKAAVVAAVTVLLAGCALGLSAAELELDARAGEACKQCESSSNNPQQQAEPQF